MDLFTNIASGIAVASAPANLLCCFVGCVIGTLVGVLPGVGPVAAIAMLLPATASLPPAAALIMLAGVYYGAQYGGSTPAILANVPGEASSAMTCIDGHQMALQGRAGAALSAAGLGSFIAGCVATAVIALLAQPITEIAFRFGPAEYFSLMVLGLVGAVVLASGALTKAIAMVVLGMLLGLVGTGAGSEVARFSFDIPELKDGIGVAVLAMGLFVYADVVSHLGRPPEVRSAAVSEVRGLVPSRADFAAMAPAILRGTVLGSLLGVLPGGGALLASFASYAFEKTMPPKPGEIEFGKGNIRGVAAPESANNAGAQTAFIPLLTLGIPTNAVMALMIGVMALHGIQPGPQGMTGNPQLFWGLVASMWAGNVMLLVLNLPLAGIWMKVLAVPYRWLFPAIVLFCAIGAYSIHRDPVDVWLVAGFGFVGYVFTRLGCEPAPLLLGFILAPAMEEHLRQALRLAGGEWSVFVTRPLSAGLLAVAMALLLIVALPSIKAKREEAFVED